MKSQSDNECSYMFEALQTTLEIFYQNFNLYMNKSSNKFVTKSDMEDLLTLSNNLKLIINDIERKFDSYQETQCSQDSNVQRMKTTFNRLRKMYEERRITPHQVYEDPVESQLMIEDYFDTKIESSNELGNQLQLESDFKEYEEYSQDNLEQINKVKMQIKDILQSINHEVNKGTQVIHQIDSNVDYSVNNVDKINDEFRKAALSKNKSSKIKYPLLIGSILGAAGSFVPGVGNAIGAGVGLGVGYAIAKIEEKSIKNIEPERYKLSK